MGYNQILIEAVRCVAEDGRDYFSECLQCQSSEVRVRIQTRIDRGEIGNFGDHKRVGRGVAEH